MNRLLPTGIQHFRTIRESNYYYVDKTALIHELVSEGRYYFLSRPRRFGKSLLVDTIKSLFEGHEELFRELTIHDHWDWSTPHPVVRLSFDGIYNSPKVIEEDLLAQLESTESEFSVDASKMYESGQVNLRNLLRRVHRTTGQQVVVLVDEYDKPVLDVLDDFKRAKENRDYLRGLYGVIKGSAEHVRFVFVTGISMVSKVNLFSGMNNLDDISLDPHYATICGYTDTDLDKVFAPELNDLDRKEIRHWYNGYNWLGEEKVYNPYDILRLFKSREFQHYWYETGTPTFLFDTLVEQGVKPIELENRVVERGIVSKLDVGDMGNDALLFQSGYLTIVDKDWDGVETRYTLDFPNFEVRRSFNRGLLNHVARNGQESTNQGKELIKLLSGNNFTEFGEQLQAYLAGIPHQWYDTSKVANFEAHYASMLYIAFRSNGVDLLVEDASSRGRVDMVVFHADQVFVLEFKVAENENEAKNLADKAMAQLRERGYAKKYQNRGGLIYLVSLVFGRTERNLVSILAINA